MKVKIKRKNKMGSQNKRKKRGQKYEKRKRKIRKEAKDEEIIKLSLSHNIWYNFELIYVYTCNNYYWMDVVILIF